MDKNLIVNADDLGLRKEINVGISKAFLNGIVTSTSIMPTTEYFDDAVNFLKDHPDLDVGIHLTLTQTKSILGRDKIFTLLTKSDKFFNSWLPLCKNIFLRKINLDEIEMEFEAQINKVLKAGLKPSHLNSHQHIHLIPSIFNIVKKLAFKNNIKFIRIPNDSFTLHLPNLKSLLKTYSLKFLITYFLNSKNIRSSDFFIGLAQSGKLTNKHLQYYLPNLKEGVTELICHPGNFPVNDSLNHWGYDWSSELNALTDAKIKKLIESHNINLINYKSLK